MISQALESECAFPLKPRETNLGDDRVTSHTALEQLTEKDESQIPHCRYTLTAACAASSISRCGSRIRGGLEIAAFSGGHCCHPLKANALQGQGAASWHRAGNSGAARGGGSRPLASPSDADEQLGGSA